MVIEDEKKKKKNFVQKWLTGENVKFCVNSFVSYFFFLFFFFGAKEFFGGFNMILCEECVVCYISNRVELVFKKKLLILSFYIYS